VALGLFTLGRRNQVVQGPTSVVGKLGEKPGRIVLAGLLLDLRYWLPDRGTENSHFGFFLCQFTHLEWI
jgi:hypothetical protein